MNIDHSILQRYVRSGAACTARWQKQYAGLDVGELRELRALREKKSTLRKVVILVRASVSSDAGEPCWGMPKASNVSAICATTRRHGPKR